MRTKHRRRHLSFRQMIPNMITSGNLLCGMLSLILTLHGKYVPAGWLIFFAVFFDLMDGKVARSLGVSSSFGVEYDSLGDVVSFGVAPALLVYSAYLVGTGVSGALVAAFFALCGALRLARFNVVHVPGPFQGLPIPAGGLFLASCVIAGLRLPPLMAVFVVLFIGGLMISSVPYGNLKGIRKGRANKKKSLLLILITMALVVTLKERAPLAGIAIYVVSGMLRFDWGKWLALSDEEEKAEEQL